MTRWNRGARYLYGYDRADVSARPAAFLFAEHRRAEGEALIQRALSGETIERAESDVRRKDGLVVPVWLTLAPVTGDSGQPVGLVAVVRDVSEQKLAAATLAESEERLRESEVLAHTGAWLWDGDDLVQWSDGMYRIHGIDALGFAGTLDSHFSRVKVDDRAAARPILLEAFALGRSFETEYRLEGPDGATAWVYVRGQPIIDAFGRPQGMTGPSRTGACSARPNSARCRRGRSTTRSSSAWSSPSLPSNWVSPIGQPTPSRARWRRRAAW